MLLLLSCGADFLKLRRSNIFVGKRYALKKGSIRASYEYGAFGLKELFAILKV
ncbi:MAG: hypothetical protein JWQ57_2982 [Mucilaginibacter sp.]|nr:hypothetical protein [Mucilaginibacter sp.]